MTRAVQRTEPKEWQIVDDLYPALRRAAASRDVQTVSAYPSDVAELSGLPPLQRAALYLAEVEGFRYQEIGQMLECSEVAARKNASRGRKRLRLALASEDR